jgi:hypothetical protein
LEHVDPNMAISLTDLSLPVEPSINPLVAPPTPSPILRVRFADEPEIQPVNVSSPDDDDDVVVVPKPPLVLVTPPPPATPAEVMPIDAVDAHAPLVVENITPPASVVPSPVERVRFVQPLPYTVAPPLVDISRPITTTPRLLRFPTPTFPKLAPFQVVQSPLGLVIDSAIPAVSWGLPPDLTNVVQTVAQTVVQPSLDLITTPTPVVSRYTRTGKSISAYGASDLYTINHAPPISELRGVAILYVDAKKQYKFYDAEVIPFCYEYVNRYKQQRVYQHGDRLLVVRKNTQGRLCLPNIGDTLQLYPMSDDFGGDLGIVMDSSRDVPTTARGRTTGYLTWRPTLFTD